MIIEFMKNSVEWRGWGWNALTVSFIATILLTSAEGWGAWKQMKAVWGSRSGASLSVVTVSYSACILASFFFFGVAIQSIASTLTSFLALVQAPILVGLWRFKGFTRRETILLVLFSLAIPAMAILPWKNELFFLLMCGGTISLVPQAVELYKTKSRGVVEIRFLGTIAAATAFWLVYGIAIRNVAVWCANILFLSLLLIIIAPWVKYPQERSQVGL